MPAVQGTVFLNMNMLFSVSCALLLSLRGRKISLVYLTVYFDGCVDVVFTKVFPT